MQMTTLKAHRYGNRQYKPGEDHEVKATDVRLLRALGWVKPKAPDPTPPAEPPRLDLRDLKTSAEKRAERPKRTEPAKRGGTYRRRDLTADSAE